MLVFFWSCSGEVASFCFCHRCSVYFHKLEIPVLRQKRKKKTNMNNVKNSLLYDVAIAVDCPANMHGEEG